MNQKNVLLVEDEKPKRTHIKTFLDSIIEEVEIKQAKSVNSALIILEDKLPDILLLDMSLPTFDISDGETGGRPQGFGGIEVLRHMMLAELICPTIVITGYEAFSRGEDPVNLSQLKTELELEFPNLIKGLIHYNPTFAGWKEELARIILDINKKEYK